MQHLGLLPVSTKASSKATKNGQHNYHPVEHRILSKLGSPGNLLSSTVMPPAELSQTAAGDSHRLHEVNVKSSSTAAIDRGLSTTSSSIPIARLYPELAEKLDLELKTVRSDGPKAVNLVSVSSQLPPVSHMSATTVDRQLKDDVRCGSDISRPAAADSLPSTVGSQFPLTVTSSNRSSFELQASNTSNLARLMLEPVVNSSAIVSSSFPYPWQTSVSGGSVTSVVHTSPQLLSQALHGLLNVTSVSQPVTTQCSKFSAPRPEISMLSSRSNQNAPLLHSLSESLLFETGKTTVKPVVRPQTVASSRSTAEDSGRLKPQPCMSCMVRPRPNWRHRVDLRLRRKTLDMSAWKLYCDHVARVDCDTDILPRGMVHLLKYTSAYLFGHSHCLTYSCVNLHEEASSSDFKNCQWQSWVPVTLRYPDIVHKF